MAPRINWKAKMAAYNKKRGLKLKTVGEFFEALCVEMGSQAAVAEHFGVAKKTVWWHLHPNHRPPKQSRYMSVYHKPTKTLGPFGKAPCLGCDHEFESKRTHPVCVQCGKPAAYVDQISDSGVCAMTRDFDHVHGGLPDAVAGRGL